MRSIPRIFLTLGLFSIVVHSVLAQEPQPTLVTTEGIRQVEFNNQMTLVGRTRAQAHSSIVSAVPGKVQSIQAMEGLPFKKGAALVTIHPERMALALKAKQAESDQARARSELARKELLRAEELVLTSVYPERSRDQAIAEAAIASARLQELEAEKQQLEIDLYEATIRMPFSGFTIKRLVNVGEWVSRGTPVFEVVDLSVVEVTLDLPERHLGKLTVESSVIITLTGSREHTYSGRVTGIAPRASETTHTFPVIVAVEAGDSKLGAGMLVRATVNLVDTFTSLAVPKDAITREGDRTYIFAIQDDRAVRIAVQISSSEGSWVGIAGDGLFEDQPVVVRGNERLFSGSPVRVTE